MPAHATPWAGRYQMDANAWCVAMVVALQRSGIYYLTLTFELALTLVIWFCLVGRQEKKKTKTTTNNLKINVRALHNQCGFKRQSPT